MSIVSSHCDRAVRFALALGLVAGTACQKPTATAAPEPVEAPAPAPEPEVTPTPEPKYPEPPPPSAAKPLTFPTVTEFQLSNGLPVYIVENHEVPLVTAEVVVRAGSMDAALIPDFTAAMLGEGTKSRSKAQIDEAIEFVGGSLGAYAGMHVTYVAAQSLKQDLKLALTLMADEVLNPRFSAGALAKLKEQAKVALGFEKSSPERAAAVLFDMVAYPEGHPYGRPFPTNEQIDAVTIDQIRQFHGKFYRSDNAFVVLTGDVTKAEAEPLLKRVLGSWSPSKALPANPLNQYKEYQVSTELTVHLVDRPGSIQSEIIVGNLAIARNHDDWAPLQVANTILGDGSTGRLFADLREKRGLTYGVYSDISSGQAPGTFTITTNTRTKTTGAILASIFEHINRIRSESPPESEFDEAVRKMLGSLPLQVETAEQIAGRLREALIYDLPIDYWARYRDQLANVTRDDVHSVARKYIHPVPHVVVVGAGGAVEPQIREVFPKAKIIKYDADLQPQG